MPVNKVEIGDGHFVHFGRKRPAVIHPHLTFSRYIDKRVLPLPPQMVNYGSPAFSKMYLNDRLGDCVIAAVEHAEGGFTANANPPAMIYSDQETIDYYSAACGYVFGNESTDNGCEIQTVLSYWQRNGAPIGSTHKIAGVLGIDPTDPVQIQTAIWLFGPGLIFGTELPDKWISPFPSGSGFVWDVSGPPNPNNGHCYLGVGYGQTGVNIATWGMTGTQTYAAIAAYNIPKYYGELYIVISHDWISNARQIAPNGFNWQQLQDDFAAFSGQPPTPPPPPPPPPPPITHVPGTAAWFATNLSPAAMTALAHALTDPTLMRGTEIGSPGWLRTHLGPSYYSYSNAIQATQKW
jgi:hypothetical protein